uniref:At1g61320/AtMIF1 LRR domain-containing protein n=1 Tax=Arundo donax TaxID=35708 RepID=A0A0A9HM82_ARUDO
MESLEVWNTTYSHGDDFEGKIMFPVLVSLVIRDCPRLRLRPFPPRAEHWKIENSDNVLSSWEKGRPTCASSSASRTYMRVKSSKVPLHQWRLLHHLPALTRLSMEHCSDLTSCIEGVIRVLSTLKSLSLQHIDQPELPKWLAHLTSLEELDIRYCKDIKALPGNVLALTKLEELNIYGCSELKRWCVLEENTSNLAHIKISIADNTNQLYRVYRSEQ